MALHAFSRVITHYSHVFTSFKHCEDTLIVLAMLKPLGIFLKSSFIQVNGEEVAGSDGGDVLCIIWLSKNVKHFGI